MIPSTRPDQIVCDGLRADGIGCGATYTYAERQTWTLSAVNQALLPLEMWRQALPRMFRELQFPHRSTWYRWERSALTREGVDEHGNDLYRGGEVIDLLVREQPRIVGNRAKTRRVA